MSGDLRVLAALAAAVLICLTAWAVALAILTAIWRFLVLLMGAAA